MSLQKIPLLYRKALQNIFTASTKEHPKTAKEALATIRLRPCERQQVLRDLERMNALTYRHGYGRKLAQVEART